MAHSRRHLHVAFQLQFKRSSVKASSQWIRQRLMLDLPKQSRVVDGDGDLVSDGSQKQHFVFLPDSRGVSRTNEQNANKRIVVDQRHSGQRANGVQTLVGVMPAIENVHRVSAGQWCCVSVKVPNKLRLIV